MTPQGQQLLLASDNLMPISKAAELAPYSAEYLSLLARKGVLQAVKIGRDWLTTSEAVVFYVKKQQKKHAKMLEKLQKAERSLR